MFLKIVLLSRLLLLVESQAYQARKIQIHKKIYPSKGEGTPATARNKKRVTYPLWKEYRSITRPSAFLAVLTWYVKDNEPLLLTNTFFQADPRYSVYLDSNACMILLHACMLRLKWCCIVADIRCIQITLHELKLCLCSLFRAMTY